MKDVIPIVCPICKSYTWKQVYSSNEGYSMGKGILGAVILGPVGAVAGINGKKRVTYRCDKCGFTATYNA